MFHLKTNLRSLTIFTLGCVLPFVTLTLRAAEPQTQPARETAEQRDARMKWWREAKFGLFIHWGIYSVPAGTWQGQQVPGIGEWIMNRAKISVADYAAFAPQFNPVKFDAEQWVKMAKDAGMKYIVITSKHHDGFAMFHSATSPYNIFDATPFKRDPLAELAEACKKQGIKLGFYYSQSQDWHHPGGAANTSGPARPNGATGPNHWDPAQDGDYDAYLRNIAVPQVKEILTKYGQVSVLWFDTPNNMTAERADLFLPLLKLQPGIIVNNRLASARNDPRYRGDTETPEQNIPANGYANRDWETCMTINDTWGYKSFDTNFKSTQTLLRNLIDISSKGGNYLLNVGPTAEGIIPQPEIDRLMEMGAWLKVNGEAIYGSKATPFKTQLPWGRCTQKDGKLYLFVFDWPADGKLLVPLLNQDAKAWLLTKPGTLLEVATGNAGLTLTLPAAAPDKIASVIVLDPRGPVEP